VNGKAHAVASLALAGGLLVVDPIVALGCACGMALTPDLDQEGLSSFEQGLIRRTWGLGFLWCLATYPYARLFRHRGISHWPLIGTLTRLIYFGGPLLGLLWFYAPEWLPWLAYYAPAWAAGLALSDGAHWVMDWCVWVPRREVARGRMI
jgi:uncharacterized metal-binding protein